MSLINKNIINAKIITCPVKHCNGLFLQELLLIRRKNRGLNILTNLASKIEKQ